MKGKLILSFLLLSIMQLVNGQHPDTTKYSSAHSLHNMYMQNRTVQNTAGWVVLGGGLGMAAGGFYIYFTQAMGKGR